MGQDTVNLVVTAQSKTGTRSWKKTCYQKNKRDI